MKIIKALVLLPMAVATSLQAQIASETFESYQATDNLTTPLNGGTGWTGNWGTTNATTASGVVSNATPVGSGQYLSVNLTNTGAGAAMGIGRVHSSGAQTEDYTVSFSWRADAVGAGFNAANDRFEFYSANSAATLNTAGNGGNATTSPYLMGVFGGARGTNYTTGGLFGVYSAVATNEVFNANNYYNLGSVATGGNGTTLSLVAGTNYNVSITLHVAEQTWDVSVTDGSVTATSLGLNWWGTNTQSAVAFGARGSAANETRSFSFDNVQVSAIPEPASVAVLMGLGGVSLAMVRRRRRG